MSADPAAGPDPVWEPELAALVYIGGPELPARARPCRCGHAEDAHKHWRPGSDCGACGATECIRYQPADSRTHRLRARLRGWLR